MPILNLFTCHSGRDLGDNGASFTAWDAEQRRPYHTEQLSVDSAYVMVHTDSYYIRSGASITWDSHNGNQEGNAMSEKEMFFGQKLEKAGMTLKGIAGLVTQSFEIESMTKNDEDRMYSRMAEGKGIASKQYLNDGNGWNRPTTDGSLTHYSAENGGIYGTETSSSPIDTIGWSGLKAELQKMIDVYLHASGGVYHTNRGSVHVHNTVSYFNEWSGYNSRYNNAIKLDSKTIVRTVAKFMVKFMPVMKWLTMTDRYGARGVNGSTYDKLDEDRLFSWFNNFEGRLDSDDSYSFLANMQRSSYLRIFDGDRVHFENRMADTTFNATHLAMWLSINKAMTLMAIDFSRNGLTFNINRDEVVNSKELMIQHSNGYHRVDRDKLGKLYKEFVSYLAKYLKIIGSLEAVDIMDKLIQTPISQWINENGYDTYWNTELIERVFNTRNRASDDALRDKYLFAIKAMAVPFADSLNEFHANIATHLSVEEKKVKSLYQMFKRENVDIEFLGGRLVYMGD